MRRLAERASGLLLLTVLGACGGPGEVVAPPIDGLALVDLADEARLEALEGAQPAYFDGRIAGVSASIASVSVRLRTADAVELPPSPERRLSFDLPVVGIDALSSGVRARPAVTGDGVPEALARGGTGPEGWEVTQSGRKLYLSFPVRTELGPELEVTYRVRAARLFGVLAPDVSTAEVVRGRAATRNATADALFVPTGTRLTLPLPAHDDPWTFRARVEAVRSGAAPPPRLAVTVRVGARVLFEREVGDGLADGVVAETLDGVAGALEVEVHGPPGHAAQLVAPHLARVRAPGDAPNLLFVLVDTLRADRLDTLADAPRGLTPNLDRLARESLVFTESYSTCSWTLPSVSTLFTSNHAEQHRARSKAQRLSNEVDTLAGVLRDAGYQTAAVTDGGMVHHAFGLDRGFATWDATGGPLPSVLERAREVLDQVGEGPWFVFVHSYEVHSPYEPPEDATERVLEEHGDLLQGRTAGPWEVQDLIDEVDGTWRVPEDLAALLEALYDEEVRYADRELGRWLDELRADGTLDRTLLVLTSDHGEEFGDHGLLGHSDTLYREQLHVPLLLRFPPGSPHVERNGTRDDVPLSHLDLAPTLVDALGLAQLLRNTTFDGRSAFSTDRRSPIWATRFHEDVGTLVLVREGDLTWIEGDYRAPRYADSPELYDLAEDPGELKDLSEERAETRARLSALVRVLRERYGTPRGEDADASLHDELESRLEHLGY